MITKEQKEQIIRDYGRTEGDTGSPEVQIAILTARINDLTDHFQGKPEGSSLQKRSSEDGWTEKRSSCIFKKERYREIPYSDRKTWT